MERKEAIEVVRKNWPDSSFMMLREALETLIPEIKGSEDEKIRKWLIHYFKEVCDNVSEKEKKGIVAWLEKRPKDSPVLSNSSNTGKIEQKPARCAWTERDEKQARQIERIVHNDGCSKKLQEQIANWFKSLKDRVQPQQEWSEEDKELHRKCICAMRASACGFPEEEKFVEQVNNWLKSLRPQNSSVTDEELAQAKKDAYNEALDKIEYHSGEPTFDDGWDAAIWYLKKRNTKGYE